jgi:hypothetical protein
MKMKFVNDFHRTEIEIESSATGVCGPEGLEEPYAEFTQEQFLKIGRALCGASGCCCGGMRGNFCEGEDGKQYRVMAK